MSTTPESSATTPRRVAVIAVHGVADQQPGETTTAIANLLSNIDDGDRPAYEPFESEAVRLPVRAIQFEDRETHKHQNWATRAAYCREGRVQPVGRGAVDAGLEFMSSLLAGYEPSGPEETYETEMLRTYRFAGKPGDVRQVDVYEMYWADLSRLKQTWLRIFSEFYQLLFHLGSLGVHAVRAAQASEQGVATSDSWHRWASAQRSAADVLAKPVLLMNLFLPGLLLVLFAALPSDRVAATLVWGAYVLLALGLIGTLSYRRYKRAASVRGLALTVLGVAIALLVVLKLLDWPDGTAHLVIATVVAGAVAALIAAIVFFYNRRRPGAAVTAAWLGSALAVVLLVELWVLPQRGEPRVQAAVLHSAEYVYAALRVAFLVFLWFAWRAQLVAARIVRTSKEPARDRLKRLTWTARFTLSLPVVLFLLGTTVLWYLVWMGVKALFGGGVLTNMHHLTWLTHSVFMPELGPTQTVSSFIEGLINNGSGHGFGVLMGLVLLASVLATYAIAPSVYFELRGPESPRDGTASGRWLDAGFLLMRWGGRVLVFGVLVVLPAGVLAGFILSHWYPSWFDSLAGSNTRLLVRTGAILAPAGAGLLLFNRLKEITLGFRNVVDVLLDVDNYLREHPRESNPRARIATRMASLLRYVYAQNYSSLVIIAHSQGTVITADLLRFIHLTNTGQKDAGLARRNGIPISFFTMGSPLRQLYGLRFPHLYQWARHQVPGPWTDEHETIAAETGPDPAELDLAVWVNAYRSADYIGRYLWRPERCDFAFRTPPMKNDHPWQAGTFDAIASHSQAPPGNRREFCIGAGAHQHYWDGTAPQVALQLDALIRR